MSTLTTDQYRHALRCVESFVAVDPLRDTDMANALLSLAKLCEAYEREHFPFQEPTMEALAEFRRLERGL